MYVLYKTGYYNKYNYPYCNEYSITKLLFHVKQLKKQTYNLLSRIEYFL